MNERQMLLEFNLLWNNIFSNQAPGLNPYEVSLFLTQAQEVVVNSICESFEQTEELTSYLSPLVRQEIISPVRNEEIGSVEQNKLMNISGKSLVFRLPDNLLYRTYESLIKRCSCTDSETELEIVPVTQDSLRRVMSDPFKRPNRRRALRLSFDFNDNDVEDGVYSGRYSEIVCDKITDDFSYSYLVRYIAKPKPIIVDNLGPKLNIDGVSVPTPCYLNENIQRRIIAKAVEIAKSVWS